MCGVCKLVINKGLRLCVPCQSYVHFIEPYVGCWEEAGHRLSVPCFPFVLITLNVTCHCSSSHKLSPNQTALHEMGPWHAQTLNVIGDRLAVVSFLLTRTRLLRNNKFLCCIWIHGHQPQHQCPTLCSLAWRWPIYRCGVLPKVRTTQSTVCDEGRSTLMSLHAMPRWWH